MSSRGSLAKNGHITTTEYTTAYITESGVKVLIGIGGNHSLPDYAHTPNSIYAKLKKDGKTLHEMRFYGDNGTPLIEIAFHPESSINFGDKSTCILHFHIYNGLDRGEAQRMDHHPDIKEKYATYLREFNLYD